MDVLAKPWNGLVMATLEERPLRFSELSERLNHIGDRMLSLRLKELEARGLVVRTVIAGPPVRVEYHLTEVGHGFQEVAMALGKWGSQFLLPEGEVPAFDALPDPSAENRQIVDSAEVQSDIVRA